MTTIYIAGVFEFIENGDTDKKTTYYEGNAMRRSGYGTDDGVFYLLRDHLNSSSVIMNSAGSVVANGNQYYFPYGGNRGAAFNDVTTKRFTGQYHESSLPGGEGLSYYNARWYDPKLGRFLSADTIVPGANNPQALNRYSYVFNNPLRFIDPSGHDPIGCNSCEARREGVNNTGVTSITRGSITYVNRQYAQGMAYIQTNYYGFMIDVKHFNSGFRKQLDIFKGLTAGEPNPEFPLINKPFECCGGWLKVQYTRVYTRLKPVPENQINEVGLSIYLDHEHHAEEWQGSWWTWGGAQGWLKGSYHSIEDTPSNYLGYLAAAYNLSLPQIVQMLDGGGPTEEGPPKVTWGGLCYWDCSIRDSRNYDYTPRVFLDGQYQNVPWPAGLQMNPAQNDGYWQGRDE